MRAHAPKIGPSTESSTSFQVVHRSGSGLGEAQQTPWPALAGLVHARWRRGYFRYVLWQAVAAAHLSKVLDDSSNVLHFQTLHQP